MADENTIEGTEVQPGAVATPEAAPADAAPVETRNEGRGPRGGRGGGGGGRGGGGGGGRGGNDRGGGRGRRDERGGRGGNRDEDGGEELIEKLVHINRVSKTVKGGKRFGFAALVVVGDGKGRVGFGKGKAREVPEAITKATAAAKKAMVRVPLKEGRTLHHDGNGHFGAGRVTLRTAPAGTGIIAGGPMRAIFESLGVADVVTKSVGTSNPYNMIRATFEALKEQTSPRSVGQRRSRSDRRSDRGVEAMAKIKITQTGSPIRRHKTQRATLVGLGLNKMRRTVEVEDTPEVLGQVRKVAHLVSIEK